MGIGVSGNPQGDANSLLARIATSVASWFHLLKETADVIPDEGWYQINTPLRSMVFENYNADAEENNLYVHCKSKSYFNALWHNNFPEIRLRKHCRFAKCSFCVHWRKISRGENFARKAEARRKLKLHRGWANTRERGLWHHKMNLAITGPECDFHFAGWYVVCYFLHCAM